MMIHRFCRLIRFYQFSSRALAIEAIYSASKLQRHWRYKTLISVPVTSLALFGFSKISDSSDSVTTKEVIIAKADALYESGEYKQICDLLSKYRDNKDAEILWRLSRALYSQSKSASDVEAKKLVYEAYNIIEEALKVNENHWAVHKWMAVLLDTKSSYEGMKTRIKQLYKCKEHMLKANQLNPTDATTLYMLGNWCYSVADLAWYQRKIAAALFGTIPAASYEEALNYFETAEKLDPMFYSHNLLYLGKTYLKLQKKDEAVKYLKMTAAFPAKTDDDHQAKLEATKILGTI